MIEAPEGYHYLTLTAEHPRASSHVLVCDRCACMVGDTIAHDEWHDMQYRHGAEVQKVKHG